MRLFSLLCCLSVLLLAVTCKPDPRKSPQLLLLEGTWLHAHEEDIENIEVYRPNTYSFGPSRGRTGFNFEHNGLFTRYDIAPTDGLEGRKGQWKAESENVLHITFDSKDEPGYRLEIVSLEKDLLKVRHLPQ
ncbi:hypothetical protein SAMN00120144_0269 [Hymenobacter roseosalivarius DSM 11622]|uniref:Lipocalin-like domain-containing protein n=1 Tax=Hymenobacter roseosalivarius DSM 11622 TaxID=645990 RepID=A0A1W1VUP2_9BACT|nr:hypothetical protein [Hymenobacter roseosalivarius]SMB97046.1 hypothetical protein SAMN00120144_0269 [Hymenobacter roseosalivarius DSM 11622]